MPFSRDEPPADSDPESVELERAMIAYYDSMTAAELAESARMAVALSEASRRLEVD